jgi:hypothetical protein
MQRIANVLSQLKLPNHANKIIVPLAITSIIKTGEDITLCPICKTGKLILFQTLININGNLIDKENINNKGSPLKNKTLSLC